MSPEEVEQQAQALARHYSFIASIETLLRTPATLTMRFRITERCFIHLYHNTRKGLVNYTMVLDGNRVFGHDCDGGQWHRHPFEAPASHDLSPDGQKAVTLKEFLEEARKVLGRLGLV